jgi:hypothetical protein
MHLYKCLHFPQTYTAYFTQQILIQTHIKQSAKYTNCNKETSATSILTTQDSLQTLRRHKTTQDYT